MSPIIFEECYCINTDNGFTEKVKSTNEISEAKIMEAFDENQLPKAESTSFVGVHLFIMVHGFQGNHNDMRLFKNQISL